MLTANTTGFAPRSMLLTPRVTGVSLMPAASFASVAPVQGATIMASAIFCGPRGSAPCKVSMGRLPVTSASFRFQLSAVPKRVSSPAALKLISGSTCAPSRIIPSITCSVFSKVQKLPHIAHTTRVVSFKTPLPFL